MRPPEPAGAAAPTITLGASGLVSRKESTLAERKGSGRDKEKEDHPLVSHEAWHGGPPPPSIPPMHRVRPPTRPDCPQPKGLGEGLAERTPLPAPSRGIPERSSWATRPGEVLLSLSSKPTGLLSAVVPLPMALGLGHAGHPAQVPDPWVERCPVPPEPGRGLLTAEGTLLGGWGCGRSSWLPDFTRGRRSGQEKGGRLGAQS